MTSKEIDKKRKSRKKDQRRMIEKINERRNSNSRNVCYQRKSYMIDYEKKVRERYEKIEE